MSLTSQQKTALKAFIDADPVLNQIPNTQDGAFECAAVLNLDVAPVFWVWDTLLLERDAVLAFDWTRVDNLSVGKARIWETMFRGGQVNPSQANIRAGVNACYSVAGADAPNRLSFFTAGQRHASVVEKLFATGTGTTTTDLGVGPATMGLEGPISYFDVYDARNS
jgi:hypothetical protein